MKLWQKMFLFSLCFMVIAVDIVAYTMLTNSFKTSIDREIDQSLMRHESVSSSISSQVAFERLRKTKVILTEKEIDDILNNLISQTLIENETNVMVCVNDTSVTTGSIAAVNENLDFRSQVSDSSGICTVIADYGGKTYILAGSNMSLETLNYTLYTTYNITELYDNYENQLHFAQTTSLISAAALGVVMLILAFLLLRPLSRINRSIKQITKGKYSLRIDESGSREFKELSKNINVMATSIEENMQKITQVADGRKRFIDNLAHEMKTPLTSILGFADILRIKRSVNTKQRQEYAGIIVEETKRLQSLSGKLLELSSTANLPINCKPIEAKAFIEETCEVIEPLLKEKHLGISCKVKLDVMFEADIELLKSLLYNILENAIKASGEYQEIKVVCWDESDIVLITISDEGVGMTPEEIENATDLFFTNNPSRAKTKKKINLGLGLALCQEIVKRHSGSLRISSEKGHGTSVTIELPKQQGGVAHEV